MGACNSGGNKEVNDDNGNPGRHKDVIGNGNPSNHPSQVESKLDRKLPPRTQQLLALTYNTADDLKYDFTEAKVLKVYDGDSMTIGAFFNGSFVRLKVRVFGVDCDEIKGGTEITRRNAKLAKQFVEKQVLNKIIGINVLNGKKYNGKKMSEKYNRLLAIITTPDGKNLADELIAANLARSYFGGRKDNTPLKPNIDMSPRQSVISEDTHDSVEYF